MDGVVANIIDHWLDEYNKDWNDNKTKEDIKTFGIEKYVKPECGPFIMDYIYRKDFFMKASVYEGSQHYLKKLKDEGHDIYFATSSPICLNAMIEKHRWVDEHFHFIGSERVVMLKNKSLLNGDILIDDYEKNLNHFQGMRILFDQPWNRNALNGTFLHLKNWKEIYETIRGIGDKNELG